MQMSPSMMCCLCDTERFALLACAQFFDVCKVQGDLLPEHTHRNHDCRKGGLRFSVFLSSCCSFFLSFFLSFCLFCFVVFLYLSLSLSLFLPRFHVLCGVPAFVSLLFVLPLPHWQALPLSAAEVNPEALRLGERCESPGWKDSGIATQSCAGLDLVVGSGRRNPSGGFDLNRAVLFVRGTWNTMWHCGQESRN